MRTLMRSALAGATMIVLAGCGGGTETAAPSSSAKPTTTSSPAHSATSSTHRPTHTTSPQHTGAAPFKADLTVQREGSALLTLTNTGAQSVTIQGWPTLKFHSADNSPLAVPEQKVALPGAGPSITLAPGRTAFAGVKWVTGDKADPATFVATTVSVTAPGHPNAVTAQLIGADGKPAGYVELSLKSIQVGTLQPSSQGVVF